MSFRSPLTIWMVALTMSMLGTPLAEATVRKPAGAWQFGPDTVWTDGTTGAFFQPMSEAMPSVGIAKIRVTIEMSEDSGFCTMRSALRWSDDGIGWGAVTPINGTAYLTANGVTPGTTFVDVSSLGTPKAWVQFGVQTAEDAGSSVIQLCHATLVVEPRAS